jgi:hypothetical protein
MDVSVARTSAHFVPTAVQPIMINSGIRGLDSPLVGGCNAIRIDWHLYQYCVIATLCFNSTLAFVCNPLYTTFLIMAL